MVCEIMFPQFRFDGLGINKLAVSFEVSGGENIPGIPGQCATRNCTYLVRGP